MTMDELAALAQALHARFEAKRLKAADHFRAEQNLRAKLAQLAQQERDAQNDDQNLDLMRPYGADIAWAAWVGQTRRALNIDLARMLAEQGQIRDELRRHYGQAQAAETLLDNARQHQTQARKQKQEAWHMATLTQKRGTGASGG